MAAQYPAVPVKVFSYILAGYLECRFRTFIFSSHWIRSPEALLTQSSWFYLCRENFHGCNCTKNSPGALGTGLSFWLPPLCASAWLSTFPVTCPVPHMPTILLSCHYHTEVHFSVSTSSLTCTSVMWNTQTTSKFPTLRSHGISNILLERSTSSTIFTPLLI